LTPEKLAALKILIIFKCRRTCDQEIILAMGLLESAEPGQMAFGESTEKAGFQVKYSKAIALIIAGLPVLALAQTQQAAQPSAAAQQSAAPSSNSKRFVTDENFYHATPKPQPGSPAPVTAQPAFNPAAASRPGTIPVLPQPVQPSTPGVARLPQPVQPQPAALTPAATLEHSSAAAVDYANGKLTVVADHASLGTVLKLIGAKTGATVDLAPELQSEPVVARLGPDSVHEVLSRLLDSPRIDYIVFGTVDEPSGLQRILVRRRNALGQMTALRSQPGPVQARQQLDPDGNPILPPNAADAEMTQQQRMEAWQKNRDEMLQAEIKQQAEEREREKTQPPEQPAPQQQENPPQ
jgi:hypothetical protein